uniref:Sodium channel and clathrin linker 1 n=1 Tax=Sinocyclocheilus rhinocerous TaxID=307959 RepID=A0A673H096_9TELE
KNYNCYSYKKYLAFSYVYLQFVLCMCLQEKERALQMWQTASQELDRLQTQYQSSMSDGQIHAVERQHMRSCLSCLTQTNQQLLKTVAEQSSELEELRSQLGQGKLEQRSSATKVEEKTRLLVRDRQLGREEASDRRLQAARAEKFEALSRLRNSIQLAEEASLQREQAQLREKQRAEELEKMKDAMKQLIQDAAMRTRKEVSASVRKQCNVQIHRMAEELSALQLECADKETQIERAHRERKAVEEELEKVYKEGRIGEPEMWKMEALHQRCLNAERLKDETQLSLNSTKNKMKKIEMEYSEELSHCQEEVRRLQSALTSPREESTAICEERLMLQQENQQLHRDMEAMRKRVCARSETTCKQKLKHVSSMQQELCVKEQGLESTLREIEESSKNSSTGLTRLLLAQQKTISRYKDEAKNLTQAFQQKLSSLRSELNRQKQHAQELEIQMEADHQKILEVCTCRFVCTQEDVVCCKWLNFCGFFSESCDVIFTPSVSGRFQSSSRRKQRVSQQVYAPYWIFTHFLPIDCNRGHSLFQQPWFRK